VYRYCPPIEPSEIYLACSDGTLAVTSTLDAECEMVTDYWLRCTGSASNAVNSGVQVSCTGNAGASSDMHYLWAILDELDFGSCQEPDGLGNGMVVQRQCRNDETKYEKEAFPSLFCSNFKSEKECYDITPSVCTILDFFFICTHPPLADIIANAGDPATDRCIYDAQEEGTVQDTRALEETLAPILDAGEENQEDELLVEATYRVFFDIRAENKVNCAIPPPTVHLRCSNGRPPKVIDGIKWVVATMSFPSGQKVMFALTRLNSGRMDVSCKGSSESKVQLYAFHPDMPLLQCGGEAKSIVWMVELCEDSVVEDSDGTNFFCESGQTKGYLDSNQVGYCLSNCNFSFNNCTSVPRNLARQRASTCISAVESTEPPAVAPTAPGSTDAPTTGVDVNQDDCKGLLGQSFLFSPLCWVRALIGILLSLFGL